MDKEKEKTIGQRLDATIEKTKLHAHTAREKLLKKTRTKNNEEKATRSWKKTLLIVGGVAVVILLLFLLWPSGGERATTEQAASIARMLKADGVPIRSIAATRHGYEVTYAAEDAVGRFDDAIIYDWGMIYGTAAAHDCAYISITTTLEDAPLHKQTVECEAVRAFVRGVFTEEEFWLLVQHESLA